MSPVALGHLLSTASSRQWGKAGTHKRSGVLVPLFSVYSAKSVGIGDLSDLKLLIDWAGKSGHSIVQLLPMNETGPLFCPYDSVSSFAIEPAYICFDDILPAGNRQLAPDIKKIRKNFPCGRLHLDYGIKGAKLSLCRDIYDARETRSWEFDQFRQKNEYWLLDFALFKALKDFHKGLAWYDWEERFKNRDQAALDEFQKQHEGQIVYQMWLQWQLFRQFRAAKAYARRNNVLLKGDLPILVSRDSADVWAHPEFFKLEFAAGAPPDLYCAKGQRWGMPTYNWQNIAADGHRYISERLKYAQNFYDLFRIDHAVGVFRIWSIPYNEPEENQGLNGFFDPADENVWEQHGRNILSMVLESTEMLACAEDLGIIPPACPKVLSEFGIPGNDVQRWVKDWNTRHDFLDPQEYRKLAVAMLSTHDTTNFAAWWENEAGTIDEELFVRQAREHGIDLGRAKQALFEPKLSRRGRLRWREGINSVDALLAALGKSREQAGAFIGNYENSYLEKEKLWKRLKMRGPMRELCDKNIARAALKMCLDSAAIFSINMLIDLLYVEDILQGDPYKWRVNTAGTISERNWSLVLPLSLEDLLNHKVTKELRKMNAASGRV